MRIFLTIIFLLVSIGLTVIVLMQEGKAQGLGSIGGIGDTYWGKNKGRSMEGQLVRFTKIIAAAFMILAVVLNVMPEKASTATTVETSAAAQTENGTEAETGTAASTEAETIAAGTGVKTAGGAETETENAKSAATEAETKAESEAVTE